MTEIGPLMDADAPENGTKAANDAPEASAAFAADARDPAAAEKTQQAMSRRAFVKAAAMSGIVLSGAGSIGLTESRQPLLRPPGGQDEARLLAQCNRCGRCVTICHTRAIGISRLGEGLSSLRTPVMRFNLGDCDFCGDCAQVCPTGAIRGPIAADFNVIGIAVINRETCLSWVSNSCNLCFTDCPYEAITLDEQGHPVASVNRCNGCGACQHVCPVLSLRSYIGGTNKAIEVAPIDVLEKKAIL